MSTFELRLKREHNLIRDGTRRRRDALTVGRCRSRVMVVLAQAITNDADFDYDYWVHWAAPEPPVPGDRSRFQVVERAEPSPKSSDSE
jgi:hypothetical protein